MIYLKKKYYVYIKKKLKKLKIMIPLQICIGPTIRIGRESWCLPYAGFSPTRPHWAELVSKSTCPSVCAIAKHPLPEVV